jgi:hypothetical protein
LAARPSVALLALALSRGESDPKSESPPAELLAPKEGATVAEVEEFEGRLTIGGWPVIVVRPLAEGQPWWVQPEIEEVADGQFTGRAHFGNTDTPKGSKFVLVVLVLKTKEEASKYKSGTTLKNLPADLPPKELAVFRDGRALDKPPVRARCGSPSGTGR